MSVQLALLCPGQGGQRAGMFRLVEREPAARPVLAALGAQLGAETLAMLAGEEDGAQPDGIFENSVAQPLVVAGALAHWAALRERGLPKPVVALGYSVGELAAHGCAGTFGVETVPRLARARAEAMDAAAETLGAEGGGLLAVRGLPDEVLDKLAREAGLELAIDNGPGHRVLGGPAAALDAGERLARARGAGTVRRLCVDVPAHTSWLATASVRFRETLSAADPRALTLPVLAGIDGSPVRDAGRAVETLSAQLSRPIRWAACLRTAWELGARVFLELGPGDALSRIARELLPVGAEARSVSEFRTLDGVTKWVERCGNA